MFTESSWGEAGTLARPAHPKGCGRPCALAWAGRVHISRAERELGLKAGRKRRERWKDSAVGSLGAFSTRVFQEGALTNRAERASPS